MFIQKQSIKSFSIEHSLKKISHPLSFYRADWTRCKNVSVLQPFDTVASLCSSVQVDRGLVYTTVLGFEAIALVDDDNAVMREAEHPDARSLPIKMLHFKSKLKMCFNASTLFRESFAPSILY